MTSYIDRRMEHVFFLHYIHHNGMSDWLGTRKNTERCKDFSFHLIGGKCINGTKLGPFGEVCTGPPGQLSRRT